LGVGLLKQRQPEPFSAQLAQSTIDRHCCCETSITVERYHGTAVPKIPVAAPIRVLRTRALIRGTGTAIKHKAAITHTRQRVIGVYKERRLVRNSDSEIPPRADHGHRLWIPQVGNPILIGSQRPPSDLAILTDAGNCPALHPGIGLASRRSPMSRALPSRSERPVFSLRT
jgi:hypothetical protein